MDRGIFITDYNQLTSPAIARILREHGLPTNGTKPERVRRLQQANIGRPPPISSRRAVVDRLASYGYIMAVFLALVLGVLWFRGADLLDFETIKE